MVRLFGRDCNLQGKICVWPEWFIEDSLEIQWRGAGEMAQTLSALTAALPEVWSSNPNGI